MKEFYQFFVKAFLCLGVAVVSWLAGGSQSPYYKETPQSIATSGNSGGFYEFLPPGYDPAGSQTYPLLIFLHGVGEIGNGGSDLSLVLVNGPPKLIDEGSFPVSFTVNGQTFSFIVLAPQFMDWAQPDEIDSVINYAIGHYKVDTSRIYLTGLSMGGGSTWYYPAAAEAYSRKLAAILVIAGAGELDPSAAQLIATTDLPVYATHNSGDDVVDPSYTIGNVTLINSADNPPANPKAIDTIFNAEGHDAWSGTYDPAFLNPGVGNLNVYQWMLQYSRSAQTLSPAKRSANPVPANGAAAGLPEPGSLRITPNPADNVIRLTLSGQESGDVEVNVSDMRGKVLRSSTFTKKGVIWSQPLDVSNLAAGTYIIRVQSGKLRENRVFIKR